MDFQIAQKVQEPLTWILPLATKLLITEIDIEVVSPDAFFPEWDTSQWKEISRKRGSENGLNFSFVEYQRY